MNTSKYIPVSRMFELESWGVELDGLISALSITTDSLYDLLDDCPEEMSALFGLLCAIAKHKDEFDAMVTAAINGSALGGIGQ